ncbi:triphosphoribosyl-dephospho-CoA synthase [bacterium]|nr:triphosphoribosyl-dephospho-CoA synthase [bacterium]
MQATNDPRMMPDPLQPFRQLCTSPSAAIRWACILEATAPKAGNVFPGRSFGDLSYGDFISAAELTSKCFSEATRRISERMLNSVTLVRDQQGTNVNLGIVLLLGPLVAADEAIHDAITPSGAFNQTRSSVTNLADWIDPVSRSLDQFDQFDGSRIYHAIELASAGGLGTSDELDVNQTHQTIDICEAMIVAKDRDQIAKQYSSGFRELILDITPILSDSISTTGDVLLGIRNAQIQLLAKTPDTLIARKNGMRVAREVQNRAKTVDPSDFTQVDSFDHYLRSDGHQLNPGTTADLLAAALYLLLRTTPSENQHE